MKKVVFVVSALILTSQFIYSQDKIQDIGQGDVYTMTLKKMFDVSGTEATYQSAIKQMFTLFKQQYSNVGEEIWSEMELEFSKTSLDDLTEMLVPVYSKHLTIEDLSQLIEFYDSPVGKKFAKSSPLITQESMQIGQQWGMKIGQEFEKKMKERGYV